MDEYNEYEDLGSLFYDAPYRLRAIKAEPVNVDVESPIKIKKVATTPLIETKTNANIDIISDPVKNPVVVPVKKTTVSTTQKTAFPWWILIAIGGGLYYATKKGKKQNGKRR